MTSNLPWVLVPLKAAPGTAASATALGSSPAARQTAPTRDRAVKVRFTAPSLESS